MAGMTFSTFEAIVRLFLFVQILIQKYIWERRTELKPVTERFSMTSPLTLKDAPHRCGS